MLFTISGVCYGDRGQESSTSDENLRKKSFYLSICNGLVSLDAKEANLREILTEISNRTKIVIEIGADVEENISTSFREIPLVEALKKITGNWAMVFDADRFDAYQDVKHLSRAAILIMEYLMEFQKVVSFN